MRNLKELTVVVPAYNEQEGIVETIKKIKKEVPNCEIIIVDDCSKDKTFLLAKKEKVTVIKHTKNKGYGGALKTGWKAAKTKYIAFLDADLTYKPSYLPIFLKILKKNKLDIVWGNRFGGKKNEMPLLRKIGNRIIAVTFSVFTLKKVGDVACGERVFKKEMLKKIDFETLPNGLNLITAMSKRIASRRIKFMIVEMDYFRRGGASKLNVVKDFYNMMRDVIFEK